MINFKINKFGLIELLRKICITTGIMKEIKEINQIKMIVYLAGLISLNNPTTTNISQHFRCVSHDSLTRTLEEFRWMSKKLTIKYIKRIQSEKGVLGHLIIDDVVMIKPYATYIEGLWPVWDNSLKRAVSGHHVVMLFWSDGVVKVPVGFRLWEPKIYAEKYKTKIRLAMELILCAYKEGLAVDYVTFDTWYSALKLLKLLKRCKYHWVTTIKNNRNLMFNGTLTSAKAIKEMFANNRYHYYRSIGLYVRSFEVKLPGYKGKLKLAIVKNGRNANLKNSRFILTDMTDLTSKEIVLTFASRWDIEVVFRELKQLLSLEKCQMQLWEKIIGHIEMTLLAYFILDYLKAQFNAKTLPELVKHLQGLIHISTEQDSIFLDTYLVENNENYIIKNLPYLALDKTTLWDKLYTKVTCNS